MKIITKTILTIVAILFVGACATTTPTMKSLAGEYQCNLGGSNTGTTIKYVLLDTGILEVWRIHYKTPKPAKRDECTWAIVDGELHVEFDSGTIEVFRINMHTDADKKQTSTLWDRIIQLATIDKDGNRKDHPARHVFKKIK